MKSILQLVLALIITFPASAFVYGEHKLIGDLAFRRFFEQLQKLPGADKFISILGMQEDAVSKQLYFPAFSLKNTVSYGVFNALSGDHVGNPYLLEERLRMPASVLQRIIALHQQYVQMGYTAAPDGRLVKTDFNYLKLAAENLSHFYEYNKSFPQQLRHFNPEIVRLCMVPGSINDAMENLDKTNAINMYVSMHLVAIELATQSGRLLDEDRSTATKLLQYAILFNGFADHFLEDAFSAGHLIVNRTVFGSVTNNKSLHDFYSRYGTTVVNMKGTVWKAYGDGSFNDPHHPWLYENKVSNIEYEPYTKEAERIISAVRLSIQDLYLAFTSNNKQTLLQSLPADASDWPLYLINQIPSLSLVPIPYNSDLKALIADTITVNQAMQKAASFLPLRNFIRSRIGNSMVLCVNSEGFMGDYYKGGELRINMNTFYSSYNLNSREEKKGTWDSWSGYTFSFAFGDYGRDSSGHILNRRRSFQYRAGIRSNLDYWFTNKKFLALYSYTEAGVQFINRKASFVFVPSLGIQPGALFNINYYNMPTWLRIPAQYFFPLKARYGMVLSPVASPKSFVGIDIDYVF